MITAICLNASIDYTYEVENFGVGLYHQPTRYNVVAGGKGINVARVARTLGKAVVVSGFAGGTGAAFIVKHLRQAGIMADFVPIEEEPRRCTNIVSKSTRQQTQIDEYGPLVTPSEITKLTGKFEELLTKSEIVIISGSAPRGVPHTIYADLVRMARTARVPVILDARDELLVEGLKAKPLMVKPNLQELSDLVGRELAVPDGVVEAGKEIVAGGVSVCLVSLGQRGAILISSREGVLRAKPPEIEYVSGVGSGDAMVAGFAVGSLERMDLQGCLRLAVGAGAANASTLGAGMCDRESILELAQQVEITRLDTTPVPKPDEVETSGN